MLSRQSFYVIVIMLTLMSIALSQRPDTKPPFLIVDTTKIDPTATYSTQNIRFTSDREFRPDCSEPM